MTTLVWCWLGYACWAPPDEVPVVVEISPGPAAVDAAVGAEVVEVAAGERTTCLRTHQGSAWCVGAQALSPQAGDDWVRVSDAEVCLSGAGEVRCYRDGRPQRASQTPFVEQSAGAGLPCGRTPDGGVWCGTDPRAVHEPILRQVPLPAPAVQVVGDGQRTCARLGDGRLLCWAPYEAMSGVPRPSLQAEGVDELVATWLQTCWRGPEGAVQCWGETGPPQTISGVPPADEIAVGVRISCIRSDREVWCWGDADPQPAPVPLRTDATALTVGSAHGCVLLADATVQCWGDDSHGQRSGAEAPIP